MDDSGNEAFHLVKTGENLPISPAQVRSKQAFI